MVDAPSPHGTSYSATPSHSYSPVTTHPATGGYQPAGYPSNRPAPAASYPSDDGFSTPTSYTSRHTVVAGSGWDPSTQGASPTQAIHGTPAELVDPRYAQPFEPRSRRRAAASVPERGVPGWVAVGILIVISIIGGLIDIVSGSAVKGGFNVGLIAASIISVLAVRRSGLFPVVVAPPIVYFIASAAMLYERSGGLTNRSKLIDSAINWLVYGFPAIAIATAAVLVIAGVRMLIRR